LTTAKINLSQFWYSQASLKTVAFATRPLLNFDLFRSKTLYAPAKLLGSFEGEANQGVGFLKSLIDVSPVVGMPDVDMGDQAFGY